MTRSDLAAVVDKPAAEDAIESLRAEGVYDATRKVREYGTETVALPVTAAPERTAVREIVRQPNLERRTAGLDDLLRERGFGEDELARVPGSWAVVGSVVLVAFPEDCTRREAVGEALLDLHGEADTVLAREGISGERREPSVSVVAGAGDTETVHTEHGTRYALDLAEVMFSPGNEAERARMGEVVAEGERVFDMFAGIGYFALPMARAGARVIAAEQNPTAFRYLAENAVLNGVQDRIEAFHADCREVEATADRVVMGYYGVSAGEGGRADEGHGYLDTALAALEPGGVVHYHEATPDAELWERPVQRVEAAAAAAGRSVDIEGRRTVKSHSEGVWHVVLDARVA